MKRSLLLACLLVSTPAGAEMKLPATMPVSEIRPGQKIVGRTVYSGNEIVEFHGEILGILPGGWGPGEDVILARLTGPNADRYGVVAGMSGSPVFIDGKLIGALSLAYGAFMREPIAGITPIASMIRVQGSRGWPGGASPASPKPQSGAQDLVPIRTPLVMSGITPELLPYAKDLLEPYGFMISAGGASVTGAPAVDPSKASTIVPGGAISGLLVAGDVNIAATGTVTWREGKDVIAFGHSFLLYGDVELPMGAAEIVATVPSDWLSFKLGKTNAIVGAITRDNKTAIAGTIGAQARMIPVTVTLPEGEVRFSVFRNKVLTAPMLTLAVMNALTGNASYDAEATVRLDGSIKVDGYSDIALSRVYFDPGAQGASIPVIASEISTVLQRLFDNELAPASVERVDLKFAVEKGARRESRIDAAWTERSEVKAGETIAVRVRLRPYRGDAEVREVQLKVPAGTPPGSISVQVGDARYFETKDRVAPNIAPSRSEDLASLIGSFNRRRGEDSLYVRLSRATGGAIVRGVPMQQLPPSALTVMRSADKTAGGAEPLNEAVLDEVVSTIGSRVVGSAELTLQVVP